MKSSNTEKHKKLLSRMANNDQLAFNEFYDLCYSSMYQYVGFYIQDEDVRKDIISDVFVSIWHNRANMEKVQNIENYLFISIKNRSFKHIKDTNARQHVLLKDVAESELVEKMEPELVLINKELHLLIEDAINKLPKQCRLIFTLIRGEKKTYREVAGLLSISEKTVHAQMCIAVKKLGTLIKRHL